MINYLVTVLDSISILELICEINVVLPTLIQHYGEYLNGFGLRLTVKIEKASYRMNMQSQQRVKWRYTEKSPLMNDKIKKYGSSYGGDAVAYVNGLLTPEEREEMRLGVQLMKELATQLSDPEAAWRTLRPSPSAMLSSKKERTPLLF